MGKPPDTKFCKVCAAPMRPSARYCTECKSYQTLLARFLSSIDLQALIALVPVITLAFVFVKDRLVHHGSDVRITAQSCRRSGARLIASNLGDRAAALKSVTLWLDRSGAAPAPNDVYRLVPKESTARPENVLQFEPQKLKFMELRAINRAGNDTTLPVANGGVCAYRLLVELIEFDQKPKSVTASCNCEHGP